MPSDVFISYSSKDSAPARRVYDYLTARGLDCFWSEVSLPRMAQARFQKAIDQEIESSRHMVVVASRREHIENNYVEEEWRLFLGEMRAGLKPGGNLVTVRAADLEISDLPLSLRNLQTESLDDRGLERLAMFLCGVKQGRDPRARRGATASTGSKWEEQFASDFWREGSGESNDDRKGKAAEIVPAVDAGKGLVDERERRILRYKNVLEEAFSDKKISALEREFILAKRAELGLDKEEARTAETQVLGFSLEDFLLAAEYRDAVQSLADGRISEERWQHLQDLRAELGLSVKKAQAVERCVWGGKTLEDICPPERGNDERIEYTLSAAERRSGRVFLKRVGKAGIWFRGLEHVSDKATRTISGCGERGRYGGPAGDVVVTLRLPAGTDESGRDVSNRRAGPSASPLALRAMGWLSRLRNVLRWGGKQLRACLSLAHWQWAGTMMAKKWRIWRERWFRGPRES